MLDYNSHNIDLNILKKSEIKSCAEFDNTNFELVQEVEKHINKYGHLFSEGEALQKKI